MGFIPELCNTLTLARGLRSSGFRIAAKAKMKILLLPSQETRVLELLDQLGKN